MNANTFKFGNKSVVIICVLDFLFIVRVMVLTYSHLNKHFNNFVSITKSVNVFL